METSAFGSNIAFVFMILISFVIIGSIIVQFILVLMNLLSIRFKRRPPNKKLYLFIYIALHVYLFQIFRPVIAASDKEWLLPLAISLSFVLFVISKDLFSNLVSYLFIKLLRFYKKGDIIKIGNQIGEVRSSNLFFSKLKIHPGKDLLISNNNVLRRLIHNYSYDNLQRHTINFQLRNTDNHKGITNGILLTISGYPSLIGVPKPRFYLNQLNNKNTMATIYFWSSIANSSIIYDRIFKVIQNGITLNSKRPRFFSRDFEILRN